MAWQVAAAEALALESEFIEPAHLLIGVCSAEKLGLTGEEWDAVCARVAPETPTQVRRRVRKEIGRGSYSGPERKKISRSAATKAVFAAARDLPGMLEILLAKRGGLLEKFGRDLTAMAQAGKLGPCIGRREELLQLVRTLSRATKNNPLLLGDAGVGKTAIVEGLAWRIAMGKSLAGRRIVELRLTELVAGTKYRGELEERLTGLLREAAGEPGLILFIDEIHRLLSTDGAADALKPALARGELSLIGATTVEEYRKFIEKDSAVERRFQAVTVDEPSVGEAIEILRQGYVGRFEARHGVGVDDEAVEAAVRLAARYLPERRLPDKAIDLLDEACAAEAVPVLSAVEGAAAVMGRVTAAGVAAVLERWTGIAAGTMDADERERLRGMAGALRERVIGQDEACEAVARVVQRARTGLRAAGRPVGVLLFLGPTGVGKTELAKATASFLFGQERALVRIDMSEFMEKHAVARLIGSPPGYVGHEEPGQLTGALRRTPYCVVLLDEVEKAHPDVLNLFLQVFDDGRVTDGKGRVADATNALFVLTSNAASTRVFRPELVNRFDEVVEFGALGMDDIEKIAGAMLRGVAGRLRGQGMEFSWGDGVEEWLGAMGYDAAMGARALRRAVEQWVEDPVAELILQGRAGAGRKVRVEARNGALVVDVIEQEKN